MDGRKTLLICALLSTASGALSQGLQAYVQTDGALILSLVKRAYSARTATECAAKCDAESSFTCRSFVFTEEDGDCLTIPANSKVQSVYPRASSRLYEKSEYLKECVDGIGTNYRGTKSTTKSGRTCQEWASRSPHSPNINPQRYPKSDLESNFCRNPDNDAGGPWCYTMDSNKRWESCDVVDCASRVYSDNCLICNGEDYRGKASTTESGYTCQHWDAQTPHSHGYISALLPDKHLEENYCRNPDGEPRPWCFTTNPEKRWDFCDILQCAAGRPATEEEYTCITGDGTSYRGTASVTVSGKACQMWSFQSPHKHSHTPENYQCKGLEANYCRNPNGEKRPWCYTSDPFSRWEYCSVPRCGEEEPVVTEILDCYTDNGSSYRGTVSETLSGKRCQDWSSMFPHRHQKTPQAFPQADLQSNLCRNPDNDRAPWCFTTDPLVRWEFCKLQKCSITRVSPQSLPAEKKPDPVSTPPLLVKDCKVGNGEDYKGPTSTTLMGITCQAWDSMEPHPHSSFTSITHPDKGLEGNQCRNPDKDVNGPWCYTTDENKKWDYCQIPDCSDQRCGKPQETPIGCFGRILGECVAKPHSWPWQISLRDSSGSSICGGTLIDAQWVLTAEHCLTSPHPSSYRVYAGIHTEKAIEPSKQMRDVEKIIREPSGKDIALLKLDMPFVLNDKVSLACLPEKDHIVPTKTKCYITGWGDTRGTGGDGFLKETGFPVIENTICNLPIYLNGRVKDHEMCAGNIEGGTDSCKGDSGGPLVCVSGSTFTLQGVTSWGLGCGRANSPGVGSFCHIMGAYKALLTWTLLCTVTGVFSDILDAYSKTDGTWIITLVKRTYTVNTAADCAAKCDAETAFLCRAFVYVEKDEECVTLPSNSKLEPLLRRTSSAFYEKKEYLQECITGNGSSYRGTKSRTKTGKTCQRWASTFPHKPNITPEKHPMADLESNYCRNPDNDANGPWCYTMDPSTRWENCDIQDCTVECMQCSGEDYRGKISKTVSGYTCQRWDVQTPHNHGYLPAALPDKYLEENYCRNPDGEPRPWCFTTNPQKRWEFCNISRCTSEPPTIVPELTCATGDGINYRGTVSVTVSGKACQMWSAQFPHKHSRTPENYPCKGLEVNYCRNPDSERSPWCYTSDSETRWEYCKVPSCGNEPAPDEPVIPEEEDCYTDNGSSYRGAMSETISGKKCQFWSSMVPHRHQKTPQAYPQADLRRNRCRNPDNDRAPWCYTTDPAVRWEFCRLDRCPTTEPQPTEKPVVGPKPPGPAVTSAPPAEDCKTGNGVTYRGPTSMTVMGITCQAWSSMTPHQHASFTPESHPDKGLEGNQCRNPDNDVNGPWCYTTDSTKKWDYCQIPDCSEQKCGQPATMPKRCFGRIVGGCQSKPHSWPWQISLRTSTGIHFCGGTLINAQWVLTAAHCLERSKRPSSYKVYLGIHFEKATEPSKQIRDLEKLILEPTGKDIALLKLSKPAILNDKVLPVCLPEKDYIVPGNTECYVTGWGETQGTGGEGVLKETGFPVIENKICNRPAYLNGRVKEHEMCAGNIEGGTDSCQGDSGGPLVCFAQKTFILQGVTSWGLGCANAMKPGVYARVSKFVDWINSEINKNSA
ncbi:hypothetical protein ACEWY4_021776 [Coilia grayii]|uniref:Plasmin n=1 Tax=Coilia grayii TaxID=363190 RepID=A0ABD1J459_9TELE